MCTVEKNKIGSRVYYTLIGSDGIEFDSSKRKTYNKKETKSYDGKFKKYNCILSDNELRYKFDGFYVYAHYMDEEIVYIGKGCGNRAISDNGRKYQIDSLTDIKILERFKSEDEALIYEKEMIEYYQSIGQCKYNDKLYREGYKKYKKTKTKKEREHNKKYKEKEKECKEKEYKNLILQMTKLENKKEKLENKISDIDKKILDIDKKIEKIQEKLDNF